MAVLSWLIVVSCSRDVAHVCPGSCRGGVQRFGSTVAGAVPVMSEQRLASPHSAGSGGIVTGVGGWDSGNVRCAA